jgi:hypothetical protein
VANGSTSVNSCGNSCTVCQAPANGSVTCNGWSCVQSCKDGYHLCNGSCLPNNSVEGCGTASCTPCRVPANGAPTCNATVCGFECNSNYHKCGNNCFANNDPNNCGSTCTVCPTDLNGKPSCTAGQCKVVCNTGYHWCDNVGRCVINNSTSTASCGNDCLVCPTGAGARATCDGTRCGLETLPCPGADEIRCDTVCVKEDETRCGSCTNDCTATTPPANTSWTCQNSTCTLTCTDHTLPTTCGAKCEACKAPDPNTKAICTAELKCGTECVDNYHRCASGADTTTCYLNSNPDYCGTECKSCPTPDNSTRACVGGKCEFTCEAGYHRCKTPDPADTKPCKADNSDQFCGENCVACDKGKSCQNGELGWACADIPVVPVVP